MIIDEYGCIALEGVSWPESVKTSCAESARYAHLRMLLGNYVQLMDLKKFITPISYLCHPSFEGKFSTSDALSLYLALRRQGSPEIDNLKKYIWRKRRLLSMELIAEITDSQILRSMHVMYQWIRFKKEHNRDSLLNLIHVGVYAPRFLRRLFNKKNLKASVEFYYENEPNCGRLVQHYHQVIERYFT